jgi:hypothetical protein
MSLSPCPPLEADLFPVCAPLPREVGGTAAYAPPVVGDEEGRVTGRILYVLLAAIPPPREELLMFPPPPPVFPVFGAEVVEVVCGGDSTGMEEMGTLGCFGLPVAAVVAVTEDGLELGGGTATAGGVGWVCG